MGFCWLYALVVRLVLARHPRVCRPQGRLENGVGLLRFDGEAFPPVPAFFRWSLRLTAVHSATRRFVREVALESASLPVDWPRGRYEVAAVWVLEDLFGFTRLVPQRTWNLVVVVEPLPLPFSPPPPPATRPGPWRPRRAGRRAGDPFDVRPYTPGDDLRRLHWPLYAHSDVPFVRTAEPSPPPTGHQFLVLDLEAPDETALDERLGQLVTWLNVLDAQGTGWTLVVPAVDRSLHGAAGPVLAALTPAVLPDRPIDPTWPETVTLVTGAHSRGAARLARGLAATRRRYRPVVLPSRPASASPLPWWRRAP